MSEQLANEALPVVREDYNVVAYIYVNSIIHLLMGRVWESLTKLGTYSVNFGIACLSVIWTLYSAYSAWQVLHSGWSCGHRYRYISVTT